MNQETIQALKIILDFVERWNKQDKEVEVVNAVVELENYLEYEKEKGNKIIAGLNHQSADCNGSSKSIWSL